MNGRARNLLLSTFLGAAGLVCMAFPLHAAQEQVMQPSSGWAVSRIDNAKAPYCAMARKFGGMVLTFARNPKNEVSVAIDFQSQALNAGQNYFVILKPGYSQDRAFNVHPVSGKALVVRMGEDGDFFDALSKSENLQIDMDGEQYSFVMPDMASGLRDVQDCLASVMEPAAGDAQAKAPPSAEAPAGDRADAEDFMTPLPGAYKPAAQTADASDGPAVRSAPLPGVSSEAVQTPAAEGDVSSPRPLRKTAMQGAGGVKSGGVVSRAAAADAPRGMESGDPLAQAVPAAAAQDPAAEHQAAVLRTENARLKDDLTALQTKLQDAAKAPPPPDQQEQVSRLSDRVKQLEADNERLAESLKSVKTDSASLAPVSLADLRATEAQMDAVKADRDRLARQLEDVRAGKEDALLKASGDNWDLKQATQRYAESQREIDRLGRQVESDRQACIHDKKEAEYMLFDPRIADKAQIDKLTSLETELRQSKAALDKKDQEIAALHKDYDGKIQTAAGGAQDADALKRQISLKDQQLSEATAQAEQSRKELAALQSKYEQAAADTPRALAAIAPSAGAEPPPSIAPAPVSTVQASAKARPVESPAAPVASSAAEAEAAVSTPLAAAPSDSRFTSPDAMQSLLASAGVQFSKNVSRVAKASGPAAQSMEWETGSLFGSAEQRPMNDASRFSGEVERYVDKTRKRCQGQFAAVPGVVDNAGPVRAQGYEIACIGNDGGGAAASLLFYSRDGLFTTIAHEGALDGMDQAMDIRDKLAAVVKNPKMAAR